MTTVAILGAGLMAVATSSPAPAQQSHPHEALTSAQKEQLAFPMLGLKMFIEVDSDKTKGEVAVVRSFVPPRSGPPPHMHTREDEIFFIVRGHYRFRHGAEEIDAPPGTILFLPRNVPHVFANISDEPGEHILTLVPGGLEKMFREISAAKIELPRDIAKLQEFSLKYGIKNMPPGSMPLSKSR